MSINHAGISYLLDIATTGLLLLRRNTENAKNTLSRARHKGEQEETETDSPRSSTLERGASLLLFGNRPRADRSPRVPTGCPVPSHQQHWIPRSARRLSRTSPEASADHIRGLYPFVFRERRTLSLSLSPPPFSLSLGKELGSPKARTRCNATGETLQRVKRKVD